MNFIFLVLMPRFLKANFLQEGIIRIVNFFASFTCLCNSNQDPAQILWNRKQANINIYGWTHYFSSYEVFNINAHLIIICGASGLFWCIGGVVGGANPAGKLPSWLPSSNFLGLQSCFKELCQYICILNLSSNPFFYTLWGWQIETFRGRTQ